MNPQKLLAATVIALDCAAITYMMPTDVRIVFGIFSLVVILFGSFTWAIKVFVDER